MLRKTIFSLYALFALTMAVSHLHAYTCLIFQTKETKQIPSPLVRERTVPTELPPLVGEIGAIFQVAPQLYSEVEWTPFQTYTSQKIW
jgi:hypothetical protein